MAGRPLFGIKDRPEHSPLGASGASRWMICPGSVGLSEGVEDEEDDTFSAPGQVSHALAETCFTSGQDAWTYIGLDMPHDNGFLTVDVEMSNAVQEFLNAVDEAHLDCHQGNSWVEREFYCPQLHEFFWGKADFIFWDEENLTLHVWDYKHGAGIIVEVPDNRQCKYYACGALEDLGLWSASKKVVLHIVQPRGFHYDGPVREWETTVDELREWLHEELIPAMDTALVSKKTKSGEHCRFCPARARQCPQLLADFDELEALMSDIEKSGGAAKMKPEQVGRFLDLFTVAKIANKAAVSTGTAIIANGGKIPGWMLTPARANRQWKPGAEKALKKKFADKAYTKPELKSPALIDALPEGKKMTARWAAKPDAGYTLAPLASGRKQVSIATKSSLFHDVTKKTPKK